jgi:hypothetical protein
MLENIDMKAMNSNTYIHEPILKALITLGLFVTFSSLNRSDLDSKYMNTTDTNDAKGKAAIKCKCDIVLTGKECEVSKGNNHLQIVIEAFILRFF